MSPPLVSLAYRSRAVRSAIDERALASILLIAQAENVDRGITGAMAFGDGHFVQVLEGPKDAVLATMERIRNDRRHYDIDVTGPHPIPERVFPDWCMARLTHEPALRPIMALLLSDWEARAGETSLLLAKALEEQIH